MDKFIGKPNLAFATCLLEEEVELIALADFWQWRRKCIRKQQAAGLERVFALQRFCTILSIPKKHKDKIKRT